MRGQDGNLEVLRKVRGQMLCQALEEGQVRRQEVRRKVCTEVRCQMHAKVRPEKLIGGGERAAAARLLSTYADLAERGDHLFAGLLGGRMPKQWSHYPDDDAISKTSGFQWFYHSHSPEDRPGASEHGHIHLFALRKLWARRQRSAREMEFAKLRGEPAATANTRHLLTIGFDARGLPTTLFTVNSWVTGDRMLSAGLSAELLANMELCTGYASVDAVIESLVRLYIEDIGQLLEQRDRALFEWREGDVLSNEKLELLSEMAINVDARLARAQSRC